MFGCAAVAVVVELVVFAAVAVFEAETELVEAGTGNGRRYVLGSGAAISSTAPPALFNGGGLRGTTRLLPSGVSTVSTIGAVAGSITIVGVGAVVFVVVVSFAVEDEVSLKPVADAGVK